jgi:hypothetical protein
MKITKSAVDRATPKDSEYTLWGSELKGFGVRFGPPAPAPMS